MKKTGQPRALVAIALAFVLACLAPMPAGAATVLVTGSPFDGSDCSGLFDGPQPGFSNCRIPASIDPNQSPVLIKFGFDDGDFFVTDVSTAFPSLTGVEFSFTPLTLNGSSGTWTYTPGPDDPAIKFWVAKGGDVFNLFTDSSGLAVTSGTWSTPVNPANEQPFGLGHLSFYDTSGPRPPQEIPEPGALLLVGAALAALGLMRRRRA